MSYTLQNLTPRTGTPPSPFPASVFQRAGQPCEDQRPQSGALTELPLFTGYEPNWLAEDRDYGHFTGDGQLAEHEDLCVRPLSFHQSITASTYDSAANIATPPESDFDDEQLRPLTSLDPDGLSRPSLLGQVTSSHVGCCCCECQFGFSVTFGAGRGLRVFRTVFALRFEREPCGCNLLAQDCVQ